MNLAPAGGQDGLILQQRESIFPWVGRQIVMAVLVAAIHVFPAAREDVDGRDEPYRRHTSPE